MILGFVMMQPRRRDHRQERTAENGFVLAIMPILIVVLLTVLQVMLFTAHRPSFEQTAQHSPSFLSHHGIADR